MVTIPNKLLQSNPLAEGGEGVIYDMGIGKILKVFKPTVDIDEKRTKVQSLLKKKLPANVIGPVDLAQDENGKFIGYIMRKVDGDEIKMLSNKNYTKVNNITSKDILSVLSEIRDTLRIIHAQNMCIGDLNDRGILIDKNRNIFFIDVDSWSIDNVKCKVCMELFQDPLMHGNNFSQATDAYAFAIIAFKSLTRIHPFGGTMNPDVPILERMAKGISVIDRDNITIPKLANNHRFISPKLLADMKSIFEEKKRFLLEDSLNDFIANLSYCSKHGDYYYSRFNECPICNDKAIVIVAPIKIESEGKIPYIVLSSPSDIRVFLSEHLYVTNSPDVRVVNRHNMITEQYDSNKQYFIEDWVRAYTSNNELVITYNNNYLVFNKLPRSEVQLVNKKFYYVNPRYDLVELDLNPKGNSSKPIAKVSFRNIFKVAEENNYFICNTYDSNKVLNINGYNYVLQNTDRMRSYGIHFDAITKRWLFIYEDYKGVFHTFIFDKNNLLWHNDQITYQAALKDMCFNNGIIFSPADGAIRGLNYKTNTYKDFPCDIVDTNCHLIRNGNKFIVVAEKDVYEVG